MSSFASYNRRGAKARRTTNQPAGRMPSPEYHQEQAHKPSHDHMAIRKGSQSPTCLVRPDRTWAEAGRSSPGRNTDFAVMLPTYHTLARDPAVPFPFAANSHLMITGRYSRSNNKHNELVFRHVYPAGQATTRELLQRYRTYAHATICKRLGVNLFYTDALGDTVAVVTRKSNNHQGDWILTDNIMVQFPNKRATGVAYEQKRNQRNKTRMLPV